MLTGAGVQGEVSVGMRAGGCTGDANIRSRLQNVLCPHPPLLTSDAVIILIVAAVSHHGDHGQRVFSYHVTTNQMSI